jgi:hypothetical protein
MNNQQCKERGLKASGKNVDMIRMLKEYMCVEEGLTAANQPVTEQSVPEKQEVAKVFIKMFKVRVTIEAISVIRLLFK